MEFLCSLCPRKCNALRNDETGLGVCKSPALPRIARAALHFWEEPPISGTRGSGTVFFSGCSLQCIYCQNYEISHSGGNTLPYGKTVSVERLHEIFCELEEMGAHNINLVNPTHYAHVIEDVLTRFPRPSIPIVYNTGGYDSVETLKRLDGLIDIYLTDIKYSNENIAGDLSHARDYFSVATDAVFEMYRQTGGCTFDSDNIMKKGVIVRHLVLPGFIGKSLEVLQWCYDNLPKDIKLSVMSQFTPCGDTGKFTTLSRRLKQSEYDRVIDFLLARNMTDCYIQELSSANEEYIPPFNLEGI